MSHCTKCQLNGPADARYCHHCGHPLHEQAPLQVSCMVCKAVYAPDAVFCIADGSRLVYAGAVAELSEQP
ncbi:double zinc ribbon domain-containing protein [Deminuibacter soli]|uniref:Zinc ribbon domain-containing protein n=1 Tax=Deminuibacter soli TaxID=2291815 RepID=A0A3E1NJG9_9BACT|nr:zinc ribbon domain-containing protein [Deminuibacter soli]